MIYIITFIIGMIIGFVIALLFVKRKEKIVEVEIETITGSKARDFLSKVEESLIKDSDKDKSK